MPDQACKILSATLHQTKYHVRIALGVSDTSYCSTHKYPLYETGQGSGCSGTVWLFQSTDMMKKIGKTCQGFDITSHDTSQSLIKHIMGLVNNKRQYTNGWINNLEQTIYENIQTVVSS